MEGPDNPVTEDEVLGWFPASKVFGQPGKTAATAKLTWEIERRRQMLQVGREAELQASARQLTIVVKMVKALAYEIGELQQVAGVFASGSEIKNLSSAVNAFLLAAPGNAIGGQPKEEIAVAAKLAPFVGKCLEVPNKLPPSLISEDGPVVKVLSMAVGRLFGTAISTATLSHGLKEHRKRERLPGDNAG